MEFIEALTEGLDRVMLVRGGGNEVVTIYSWIWKKSCVPKPVQSKEKEARIIFLNFVEVFFFVNFYWFRSQ